MLFCHVPTIQMQKTSVELQDYCELAAPAFFVLTGKEFCFL